MKAFLVVCCLAFASVRGDGDADAYTIGQVAAGLPWAQAVASGRAHNPGYIAYTSYPASNYGVYGHLLGKREADSDAYTIGQVAAGLPLWNAYATGHAHNPGYIAYTSYPASNYGVYGHLLGKREADSDAYTIGQVAAGLPLWNAYATGHAHNPGYIAYTSYPASNYGVYGHPLGKREADSDAYTIGQVAAGLPLWNAYATGHAHNPGYIAYTSFPSTYGLYGR